MGFAITPIHVKKGRASFNGVFVSFEDLQGEMAVERVEVTGTEDDQGSAGTPQNLTSGIRSLKVSLTVTVNADQMPYGTVGIYEGATMSTCKFFLDKATAARWFGASSMLVLSVSYQGRLKDAWKARITMESTGGYGCTITPPS